MSDPTTRSTTPGKLRAAGWILPAAGLLAFATVPSPESIAAVVDSTCLSSPTSTSVTGSALDTFAATKSGIVFTPAAGTLGITKQAGQFKNAAFGIADPIEISCAADFDEDGWTDFVGGTGNTDAAARTSTIKFYKNQTYESAAPTKWTNAAIDCNAAANLPPTDNFVKCVRRPKFVATKLATGKHIEEGTGTAPFAFQNVGGSIVCGDFNNDNHADFIYLRCNGTTENCDAPRADMFLGLGPINRTGTATEKLPRFQPKYQIVTSTAVLGNIRGPTNRVAVIDKNGDGKLDLVIGVSTSSTAGARGKLLLALNDGNATQPKFNTVTTLITNVAVGQAGFSGVAAGLITPDTVPDLLVGSETSTSAFLYTDLLGAGGTAVQTLSAPATPVAASGHLSMTLIADFTNDGKMDGFGGADSEVTGSGGNSYIWTNNGTATPFSAAPVKPTVNGAGNVDFDGGFFMDYDHDPDVTNDMIVMDDDSGNYRVIANLVQTQYAPCGTLTSDLLPVGDVATTESTVTEVRLTPTVVIPANTSITWQASNDNGTNYVTAVACLSTTPPTYCATFGNTVGNQVRWRATLYSNNSQSCAAAPGLLTPTISGVRTGFTYVTATNHFRAGPVAQDGLIYEGAARQPGGAGVFFALDDQSLSSTNPNSWEAGANLNAMTDSSRVIYTVSAGNALIPFDTTTANANSGSGPTLRTAVSAASKPAAVDVVSWVRSARFGLSIFHRLGAIENSTAAVLTPPVQPGYYDKSATTAAERTAIDAFLAANTSRPQLVFVGSRDGMLHAFHTSPGSLTDPKRGKEAWAFIPYNVAQTLIADCTASSLATPKVCAATNKGDGVTTYPDGSPTLVDVKISGSYKTVLIMGNGNGGSGIFALDVTNTVNPDNGVIIGPTPLWQFSDVNMGRTYSKPAVVRVKDAGVERFLAVFASGPGSVPSIGDSVYAIDIATGVKVWEFNTGTTDSYIATAVSAYETDDVLEGTPAPVKDGYMDRIVFADSKGRVFKLDPAVHTGTSINALGSVNASLGTGKNALFSTKLTSGALGFDRAVAGSIGIGEDLSNRVVLFFGTGGTDDTLDTAQNEFYAVYADIGAIRNKFTPVAGVKFFGGVSVLNAQVIFSTGKNLTGTGLCATTAGAIQFRNLNTLVLEGEIATASKIVAPMYTTGTQIYTVTVKGTIVTSEYKPPGTTSGGASGGGGPDAGVGDADGGSSGSGMSVLGWRQVTE